MQDFLTAAIGAIALASTVYFVAGFALIVSTHTASPIHPTAELPTQTEDDAVVAELHIAPAPVAVEEPVAAPTAKKPVETNAPDWSAIAPAQLRKECTARSIKWKNAHGKNLHLKKAEMVAALKA